MPVAVVALAVGAALGFGTAVTVSDGVREVAKWTAVGAGVYLAAKYGGAAWKG